MSIVFVMIPVAIVLALGAVFAFRHAVVHGQYDDLAGPPLRVLEPDDQ